MGPHPIKDLSLAGCFGVGFGVLVLFWDAIGLSFVLFSWFSTSGFARLDCVSCFFNMGLQGFGAVL